MKGTHALPRVVRLSAVDTARSTIKPRPPKTDGVNESVQCVHEHALADTQSQRCPPVLAWRCAPCYLASDLERRTGVRNPAVSRGAATTREGRMKPHARENHGPQPNCRRPSVHQQNAREKTPVHAHGANNHTMDTMDTTGTYNPLKLRWHALTWKPTANGEHPTKQRDASQFLRCRTKDNAHNKRSGQRTHTSKAISYLW